jgi:hypothetical protein
VNKALDELKIQAKILLKSARNNQASAIKRLTKYSSTKKDINPLNLAYQDIAKLKHCQHVLAREVGFYDWAHAHAILSAKNSKMSDAANHQLPTNMGNFWHSHACDSLINLWFSDYKEASEVQREKQDSYLVPFKNQFIVVTQDYIKAIGLASVNQSLWHKIKRNLVSGYNSDTWDIIAYERLRTGA